MRVINQSATLTQPSNVNWRAWPHADKQKMLKRLQELNQGQEAQAQIPPFPDFIHAVNPLYQFYRHLGNLHGFLQRVAEGEIKRLMVFMPPRHSKSQTVSRLFSAYYLIRHPDRWVGMASYAEGLAFTLSRNARDNYQAGGGTLSQAAWAVSQWETGKGGGLWAAGVGGGITGKGFHLGIIDDPLKDAEEAQSTTIRDKIKDWYDSTFYTRQEPDASIILITTRWHGDDLAGYLLSKEADEPEHWHIVDFPAIAEPLPQFPPTCTIEADFRQPGEALCPERYPLARLEKIHRRIGEHFWASLYQQRPVPREGGLFKRQWLPIVDASPVKAQRVRWWDTGATSGGGDPSAGVLIAKADGIYYIEDCTRGQWSAGELDRVILQTAVLDKQRYGHVAYWSGQEPGSGGKRQAEAFVRLLAGYDVHTEPETGSKPVRATPLAAQCEAGNVKLVKGAWNGQFIDELCAFDKGLHDDDVDGASGAFGKLSSGGWSRGVPG
jgi:predicted phage terminase large subunit-like protein